MDPEQLVRISKFLSKHLRHDPAGLGLELEEGGWVQVDDLLQGCARKRFPVTLAQLQEVVAGNDKQRFSFDETGARIRANQGHSVEVDLALDPATPPDTLYHGTGHNTAETVEREGLRKMRRHQGSYNESMNGIGCGSPESHGHLRRNNDALRNKGVLLRNEAHHD
ncbi:MAG: RNA 2'-phosphotransferase, partial [Actinomycetota bacterium]